MSIHYDVGHDRGLSASTHGIDLTVGHLNSTLWLQADDGKSHVSHFQSADQLLALRDHIDEVLESLKLEATKTVQESVAAIA